MPISVHHVGIPAADPARSEQFWATLLGGAVEHRFGHAVISTDDGAVQIAVVPRRPDDPPGHAHGAHLCLAAPESERAALLARLAALGAPSEEVRGRLYARDPDGYTLEFQFVRG